METKNRGAADHPIQYRREIDGLRAFAVVPVLFFHAGFEQFSGGFVGVDIFFVISGYLITLIIIKECFQEKFTIRSFYERRARRILPALFLVMLFCIPLAWIYLLPGNFKDFSESVGATALFASNVLFWMEAGYFAGPAELKPLLHTWSLAVEEQYYLFYPILILLIWRFGFLWMTLALLAIGISSFALAQFGSTRFPGANFYFLPTRGWELLIGAMAALFQSRYGLHVLNRSTLISNTASFVGLGLIAFSMIYFDSETPFPGAWALLPCLGTLLLITCTSPDNLVGKLLGSRLLVGIGLISYSLYLWHQPLFAFARHALPGDPSATLYVVLMLLSAVMAFLSWHYVERYFRNRKRFSQTTIFAMSAAGIAFFVGFAMLGVRTDGFKERFPYINEQLAKTTDEFAAYVPKRFEAAVLRDFDSNSDATKILIIGDSYGNDMVNVAMESDLSDHIQVSTHEINANCGNVFLDDYLQIDEYLPNRCRFYGGKALPNGRYENEQLLHLMREADQVWLASRWLGWVVDYVPETIEQIEKVTDARVLVFNLKNFGDIDFRRIIRTSPANRHEILAEVSNESKEINRRLEDVVSDDYLVDLRSFYCDENGRCRLFDDNGYLLSYDGGHLTREGAVFFGKELPGLIQ